MSDAALPKTPLHDVQKQGRAAFGEVDGWLMPRVYENIKREYLSAKGTVAVMDRSNRGRLRVTGAKRLDLLNRLTTNDLRTLAPGQGAQSCLLTDKGRLIDDLRLYVREGFLYLIASPGNQLRVKETIERLRFRDDVTLEDVTTATAMISLFGPQSTHLLEALARPSRLAGLPLHHHVELSLDSTTFLAARTEGLGAGGYDLIVEVQDAPSVWAARPMRCCGSRAAWPGSGAS
jgi:glycine cleavage system T protein (aminomethyltransferase)